MSDPSPPTPPDPQLAHEAALGRALLMVQRLEEDARDRIARESADALARAHLDAETLVEAARVRAAEVAEITRSAVARVLAEEHAELLAGLSELSVLEQRLRTTVTSSQARVAAVLAGVQPVEPGSDPAREPMPAAPPPAVSPDHPSVPSVSGFVPVSRAVIPVDAPVPMPDLDLDAPVAGADDAFFADLRDAVDGQSTIAGRSDAHDAAGWSPNGSPSRAAMPPPAFAAAAAAASAAAMPAPPVVAATPAPATKSVPAPIATGPALRVVPPPREVPVAPAAVPIPAGPPPTEATGPIAVTEPPVEGRRARAVRRRGKWAKFGTGLRNAGILLLLFVVFQLWGTAALQHRDQNRLRNDFEVALASQGSSALPSDPSGEGTTATTLPPAPPPAPSGEAVAVVKIPAIGVEQAVVEGTGVSDLRKGPGHYRNTPLPGQPGNAAIAGHRTTYGAPFNRIDELQVGDPILVTTLQGEFKYMVSEAPFAVSPSQNDVLFDKSDNRLTLTTCHPKYSASKRLIVVAQLARKEKPAAVPKESPRATPKPITDASTRGDSGAVFPAILWGALALVAYLGMVWLSRRWVRRAAFLLGVPVVLALLFPFFEQLSRLLPANY